MLWEVEIRPLGRDADRERVCDEFDLLTHGKRGGDLIRASARGFLLEGSLDREQARKLLSTLLLDPLVESGALTGEDDALTNGLAGAAAAAPAESRFTVLLKPGVMDPVSESVLDAARD